MTSKQIECHDRAGEPRRTLLQRLFSSGCLFGTVCLEQTPIEWVVPAVRLAQDSVIRTHTGFTIFRNSGELRRARDISVF